MASSLFIICFLLIFSRFISSQIIYSVNIENKASASAEFRCFLRGKDLGVHSGILPGSGPNYVDIPIIPKGDNSLTCDVTLTQVGKHGHVELFNFDRDKNNCEAFGHFCRWEIQDGGMCMGSGADCNPFFKWTT